MKGGIGLMESINAYYNNEFRITSEDDLEYVKQYLDDIYQETVGHKVFINGEEFNGVGELKIKIHIHHYN